MNTTIYFRLNNMPTFSWAFGTYYIRKIVFEDRFVDHWRTVYRFKMYEADGGEFRIAIRDWHVIFADFSESEFMDCIREVEYCYPPFYYSIDDNERYQITDVTEDAVRFINHDDEDAFPTYDYNEVAFAYRLMNGEFVDIELWDIIRARIRELGQMDRHDYRPPELLNMLIKTKCAAR